MLIQNASFLPVAQLLREAAQTITEPVRRSGAFGTQVKSDDSLVTVADTRAQAFLSKRLIAFLPGAKIIGEESFDSRNRWQDSPLLQDKGDVFVIDPIDGTRRFARGEDYGMMVAHKRNGQVQAAWVYYPTTDDLLFASRHDRTTLVAWQPDGTQSQQTVTIPPASPAEMTLRAHSRTWPEPTSLGPYTALKRAFAEVRRSECIALETRALLLTGRSAQFMDYNTPWDRAPVAFLAERAGTPPVVDFAGRPATDQSDGFIIAPTRPVMATILATTLPILAK